MNSEDRHILYALAVCLVLAGAALFSSKAWALTPDRMIAAGGLVLVAFQAFIAVKQADISARQADLNAAQERPYLYFSDVSDISHMGGPAPGPIINFKAGNYGKAPASIEAAWVTVTASDAALFGSSDTEEAVALRTGDVFAPGAQKDVWATLWPFQSTLEAEHNGEPDYIVDGADYYVIKRGHPGLFLRVVIYYSGPFTRSHETSRCWRLEPGERNFTQFGGADLNYHR